MTFKAQLKIAHAAILLLGGACVLSGCGALSSIVPPAPKDSAQAVYEARVALVTAEAGALAFFKTVCPVETNCNDPRVTAITEASITADTAVTAAEATVNATNPDATAAQQAATAAQNALAAFQAILTQYGVTVSSTTKGSP